MQFSTVFFTLASALLFMAPAVSAIACDPLSACNDKNNYPPGHPCKYTLDQCDQHGAIFSGHCVAAADGLKCQ
ncbi:uncharacterized protein STEHIDRAFT_163187 [Stereum hirsutum FP-91666 SS1]|uniref:Uncharacterized protein n=1 Tax=Stereum hirsutum (strain FP-91666) TaxID=721885 RepID=R7S033_STEHR|nr:uncharacterized protein STEHIDRAFT_163187 [Stereum hirsutum FP-91666 SS1]EIM79932.1 hypothetical protein STEHIDRAFT_163187 [Stereum hirsutum FP-91666 SS1]